MTLGTVLAFSLADEALPHPVSPSLTSPSLWAVIQQAEQAVSDRERAGLRGTVRKIVEERVNGPVALLIRGKTRITTKVAEYDERGAELFREEYRDWNGDLMRTVQHQYDASGRVVEVREELWGVTRAPDFFGHVGRPSEASELQEALGQDFDGPSQTIRKRFRYEGDRLVEVEITDSAVGSEIDRRMYEYDAGGRRLKVYSSNDLGDYVPASLSEYRRFSDGSIERTTTYSLYGADRASYDPAGRLVSETISAGAAGPPRSERRYDPAGRELERIDYDRSGTMQLRRTQTYDARGNLIETVSRSSEREIIRRRYAYTYDEQGNWLMRTETVIDQESEQPQATETTFRTITYAEAEAVTPPPRTAETGRPE